MQYTGDKRLVFACRDTYIYIYIPIPIVLIYLYNFLPLTQQTSQEKNGQRTLQDISGQKIIKYH